MGLFYGCTKDADDIFKKTEGLTNLVQESDSIDRVYIRSTKFRGVTAVLDPVYGDCTAATLCSEFLRPEQVPALFEVCIKYLSMNARISMFFSKKVYEKDIQTWLDVLKPFPIVGLHIQKSNRNPEEDTYMITGILKITSPLVKDYTHWNGKIPHTHNPSHKAEFNKINATYGLPTL